MEMESVAEKMEERILKGETHAAIGLATGVGVVYLVGADSWLELIGMLATSFVASLLPDLDAEESLLQSMVLPNLSRTVRSVIYVTIAFGLFLLYISTPDIPFWVVSIAVFLGLVPFVPHRTVTHSLLMVIYLGWTVHQISPEYVWPFVAGYLSHLIADALTVSGIPFLWPVPIKFSANKIGIRIKTGSAADYWIGNVAIGLFIIGLLSLFV